MKLEDLRPGTQLLGIDGERAVSVIAAQWHGPDVVELTYQQADGALRQRPLYRKDETLLKVSAPDGKQFDADPAEYRLALEAMRIQMAGQFDPRLAVNTSDVQPLPHQISAVYGAMLPMTPLRFLLADDPGAGKTIMAGLYMKELMLRGDVQRAIVVAPGGLVEQWQDELLMKFGLFFEILSNDMFGAPDDSIFDRHPLLIARMDQLARNEFLLGQLSESEWDVAVVDEAHRMSANYYGKELKYTKRFQLGQVLSERSRHFLLMTATPHNGKEEDFQQFLTLLDRDGFEGKYRKGQPVANTKGLMRRMLKEEMVTFDGKALFPGRFATTIPYELTPLEQDLYDQVSDYVRDEMNRAERLDGKRKNTVGFALTVLQRRLASSPEAIYRSLERRLKRLEQRLLDLDKPQVTKTIDAWTDIDVEFLEDDEELDAEEIEKYEEEVVDAASAAQTRDEIELEIRAVRNLLATASKVRAAGDDQKWVELRQILNDEALAPKDGTKRKLIVFTEHRDTLDYLERQIRNQIGKSEAVVSIHGGVSRPLRRQVTTDFTTNPDVQILVATDAAGEGLNLQAAHLMVNYDLPWNPNRIDQRFGRVHRIGQPEDCHLWNLVAHTTREGQVYERLLQKLDEQHKAYGGKVFEVLGKGFQERSLRDLLMDAIRYGDDPTRKAERERVIDASAGANVKHLIEDEALAHETLGPAELSELKRDMEEARARRLQPHFIERFFRDAFKRLGGRLGKRDHGRFEIVNVPARLRPDTPVASKYVAAKYERVTFDVDRLDQSGDVRIQLLAPGHPLFDAVVAKTVEELQPALDAGATFVSETAEAPQVLVGLHQEVVNGRGRTVAEEFGFAFVGPDGVGIDAGAAPHLDLVALDKDSRRQHAVGQAWVQGVERAAVAWAVGDGIPELVEKTARRTDAEVSRQRARVNARLTAESDRLYAESLAVSQKESEGKKVKQSAAALMRRGDELVARRDARLKKLDAQRQLSPAMPRVFTSALVLPIDDPAPVAGDQTYVPRHAAETKEVERRAVEAVLAAERALGRIPEEMPFNNKGFDIRTQIDDVPTYIEVKGRIEGADGFIVSASEVLHGKNNPGQHILAIVKVSPDGESFDEVRYIRDEFIGVELANMETTSVYLDWKKTWAKGLPPS